MPSIPPPPPSGRPSTFSFEHPFPLVQKSEFTKSFVNSIMSAATESLRPGGHRRAFPLLLGANWLELPSLLLLLARHLHFSQDCIHVNMSRTPLLDDHIMERKIRCLVIANGDKMSTAIQEAYIEQELPHIRVFIPIIRGEPENLVSNKSWLRPFYKSCTRVFAWPNWSQRTDDHRNIIREMTCRLEIPSDSKDALRIQNMRRAGGTDEIYAALKEIAPKPRPSFLEEPHATTLFPPSQRPPAPQ